MSGTVQIRSYATSYAKRWESDVNGAIPVGVGAAHGGSAENRTPEHLLIAALLNCQIAGFQLIAEKSGLSYETIEGVGVAHVSTDEWKVTKCELDIVVSGAIDEEKTRMILDKADERCIVKNTLNAEVEVRYAFD